MGLGLLGLRVNSHLWTESALSASEHLAVLVTTGLLRAERAGRQRLYSIASPTSTLRTR